MERSNYFQDQYVLDSDLNNTEQTKSNQIIYRTQAPLGSSGGIYTAIAARSGSVVKGGIYGSPADYESSSGVFKCAIALSAGQISVKAGTALAPTGELIINSSTQILNVGQSATNYDWTASPSVLNYIKLQYLEIASDAKADDPGALNYTRYTGSYFIQIDSTPPDLSTEILLATFMGDGTGLVTGSSIQDERLYVRTITSANAVILDPTRKPYSAMETVQDHILSLGTGSASVTNPHGLSLVDLGWSDSIEAHWMEAHSAGIIDVTGEYAASIFSSFLPSITGDPNTGYAHIYIAFQTPSANAAILVNGTAFPAALTSVLDLTDTVVFTAGDVYYWIYVDTLGAIQVTSTDLSDYREPDKFVLCSVQRKSSGTMYDNFIDLRGFFAITVTKIRADIAEPSASLLPLSSGSTLKDNLERIRHQIGMAINGSPTSWAGSVYPLTDGPTSEASSYHTHLGVVGETFILNTDAGADDTDGNISYKMSRGVIGGSTKYAGMQWTPSTNNLKFYSDIDGGVLASASVAAISIGGNVIDAARAAGLLVTTEGSGSIADVWHNHNILTLDTMYADTQYNTTGTTEYAPFLASGAGQGAYRSAVFVTITVSSVNFPYTLAVYISPTFGFGWTQIITETVISGQSYHTVSFMVPKGWYFMYSTSTDAAQVFSVLLTDVF